MRPTFVALIALGLGSAALAVSLMHSHDSRGRVVQIELAPEDLPPLIPVDFPLDDFALMRVEGDQFVALYVYPPGFFGHVRGCRVHWEPHTTYDGDTEHPVIGIWTEGCSGAKWNARGRRLFGPPGRDLDRFPARVVQKGERWVVRVDTQDLQCRDDPCDRVWGRR